MRAGARWLLLAVTLCTFACDGAGCNGCSPNYLAEAQQLTASVRRDFAGHVGEWTPCEEGDEFRLGDGLRTGDAASALLAMQPNGRVLVEANTTIRFELDEAQNVKRLDIETGSVEVETAAVNLEIGSSAGVTRVEPRSKVTVATGAQGRTRIAVQAGRAVIERKGERRTLEAGEQVELEVGVALIERVGDTPAEPTAAATPSEQVPVDDEAEPAAGSAPAAQREGTEAPSAPPEPLTAGGPFEVGLSAGESATVHDASPPTRVAVQQACGSNGALIELAHGGRGFDFASARVTDHASFELAPGSYRYRVRCLEGGQPEGQPSSQGRVRVVADAATRRLPAKAQRVTVDADGRAYRIQYSNRLPRFTFLWRDAPPADGYRLTIQRAGARAPLRKRTKQPRLVLPEGALGEGQHRYTWSTLDDAAQSKPSSLHVAFENLGRTAYVAGALPPGSRPGTLRLSGGALSRSRVSVGRTDIPLDLHGRFSTEIPAPEGGHVAVRVAHPTTGVHYYLRDVQP